MNHINFPHGFRIRMWETRNQIIYDLIITNIKFLRIPEKAKHY